MQMQRQNFEHDTCIMASITMEKLEQAQSEEAKGMPISDPTVHLLKSHVNATVGCTMGSDQSWFQLQSQIWSTAIYLGPPYLWITINPTDLHDPIAQVFAGENINLNNFILTMGPNKDLQAKNITKNIVTDPYAAVKFFHFLINTILVRDIVPDQIYKISSQKWDGDTWACCSFLWHCRVTGVWNTASTPPCLAQAHTYTWWNFRVAEEWGVSCSDCCLHLRKYLCISAWAGVCGISQEHPIQPRDCI